MTRRSTTARQRQKIYDQWNIKPRDEEESRRYASFINAQFVVGTLKGQLIEAKLVLEQATKALDKSNPEIHVVAPAPETRAAEQLQALSLMAKVAEREKQRLDVFSRDGAKLKPTLRYRFVTWMLKTVYGPGAVGWKI